jgi:hypothetical protein
MRIIKPPDGAGISDKVGADPPQPGRKIGDEEQKGTTHRPLVALLVPREPAAIIVGFELAQEPKQLRGEVPAIGPVSLCERHQEPRKGAQATAGRPAVMGHPHHEPRAYGGCRLVEKARMRIPWVLPALALPVAPVPGLSSAGHSPSSSKSSRATKSRCATCPRDSHGKIKRSAKAKDDFRKAQPCPGAGTTAARGGPRVTLLTT